MIEDRKVIALVPARGGSKGLPRKNLARIRDKSLLERAAECGLRSSYVDRVVVSTDDDEIAVLGDTLGCEVFMRSGWASTDDATAADVVTDFVDVFLGQGFDKKTLLIYLQPTSPFRTHEHVDSALEAMRQRHALTCVSVAKNEYSPYKSLVLNPQNELLPLFSESHVSANRQVLPQTFRPNGAIYVFPIDIFLYKEGFPISGSLAFEMSRTASMDIDSPEDFAIADLLAETLEGGS